MDARRARRWLRCLAGDARRVAEARDIDLGRIIALAQRHARWRRQEAQIDHDLSRTTHSAEERAAVRRVLLAWASLNSKVEYTQGMHMVAGVLLRVFAAGGADYSPLHDALASLSGAARINAAFTPLHAADGVPVERSRVVAVQMCVDVANHAPGMRAKSAALLPWLQMFVLKCFPVLFANIVAREDALREWWDFIFADRDAPQDACRHLAVAALLSNRRLFLYGESMDQCCKIFESLLQLTSPAQARAVVASAAHLSRVEHMSGKAM